MTVYWLSTKSSPRLMDKRSYETDAAETFLRDNTAVDAALLAIDLRMSPSHVRAYQRRIGVRALSVPGRRSK